MSDFGLSADRVADILRNIAQHDRNIKTALDTVGPPPERRVPADFAALLRIMVGQQLSVKAAATIWQRLCDAAGADRPGAEQIAALDDDTLRGVGLSRSKLAYARALTEASKTKALDFAALPGLSDADAKAAIVAVKGFGPWSADMFLMFALGRPDIWPAGDLIIRRAAGKLAALEADPPEKHTGDNTGEIGDRWRPNRSAVALLCWHMHHMDPL